MRRGVWKSIFTFVLVLVLTVGTVAALSIATAAKTETAPARYSQKVREAQPASVTELSAPIHEDSGSPLVSIGACVSVLAVTGLGCTLYLRSRRKEQEEKARENGRQRNKRRVDRRNGSFTAIPSIRRI